MRPSAFPIIRRQAGFSFIEIVWTAALLGIVTVAAVPRIPRMLANYAINEAVSEVALDLRLARERAITSNARARLQFTGQTYVPQRESPAGSNAYVNDGALQTLPSGITVATNPSTPTFDSRGLTTQQYTVTFTDNYGTSKTITVTATGRINAS